MIYGSYTRIMVENSPYQIKQPYELLELSSRLWLDATESFAISESAVLQEAGPIPSLIIVAIIKFLKKFGIAIAALIAAFIAFISKKVNDKTEKEYSDYKKKAEQEEKDRQKKKEESDKYWAEKKKKEDEEWEKQRKEEEEEKRKKYHEYLQKFKDRNINVVHNRRERISVKYNDWNELTAGIHIDSSVIDTFIGSWALFATHIRSFVRAASYDRNNQLREIDQKPTKIVCKALSDSLSELPKIIQGGKSEYFAYAFSKIKVDIRPESNYSELKQDFGEALNEACEAIKDYRNKVKEKEVSDSLGNIKNPLDTIPSLSKDIMKVLNNTNQKLIQPRLKKMISTMEDLKKEVDKGFEGSLDIGHGETNAHYGKGNVSEKEGNEIREKYTVYSKMIDLLQAVVTGMSKCINTAMTEVTYCVSQSIKEYKRINGVIRSYKYVPSEEEWMRLTNSSIEAYLRD